MPRKTNIRDKGTGSIYREGDRYRVQVTAGYSPDGRQKYIRVRCRTHQEAVETLNQLLRDVATGRAVPPTGVPLDAFLQDWLRNVVEPNLAPKTALLYRGVVQRHIVPVLGRKPLEKITRNDVQRLLADKAREMPAPRNRAGIQTTPRTLSYDTLRVIRATLQSALGEAVRRGIIPANPADDVRIPKKAERRPTFLEPDQAAALVDAALAKDPEIGPLVYFLIATGARIGEATGLRWPDVDLDRGLAWIRGQLQRMPGQGLLYRPWTKTGQERAVPLAPDLVQILRKLRQNQTEPDPEGVVFLNAEGRRIDPKHANHRLKELCRLAGVPEVSAHKLRHTAATLALAATGDIHGVQKMLGHRQVALTANLYGHATAETLRPLADAVSRTLRRNLDRPPDG